MSLSLNTHTPLDNTATRLPLKAPVMLSLLFAMLVVGGCANQRVNGPAPVEDRTASTRSEVPRVLPGAENAGKPGYYTVRPGDTLYRVALDNGQSWRDLQAWNALSNPNLVEVGQVLRVVPPVTVVSTAPVSNMGVVARPLPPVGTPAPAAPPTPPPASTSTAPASELPAGVDAVTFIWPAQGNVVASFDELKNKGVGIGGRPGDPVLAAADGRVVYAGAGLRGYGNLIILKHNNTYLTAYAHNQSLLVREDQSVRQGQKIAEMGSSDADSVKLHFEVRRQGKPVDPMGFLPKR
jgi:lipoprotein NlpD